jgi:hypothetical protein
MDLLTTMKEHRREASWAVWEIDGAGKLTGNLPFPLEQAGSVINGRAMFVSLNPGSDRAGATEHNSSDWANFHSPDQKHNDVFLAEALVDTSFWGSYMVDLHPEIAQSDSRLVRPKREEIELRVKSLIEQARQLASVENIVCVGKESYTSVARHSALIERDLGLSLSSIVGIPHYSRAAAGVHKRKPELYRALVNEALGERRASR